MKEISKSIKIQVPTPIVYNFIRSEGGKAGEVISDFPSFGLKVKTETLIEDEAERNSFMKQRHMVRLYYWNMA